jgi:hypothetical protein
MPKLHENSDISENVIHGLIIVNGALIRIPGLLRLHVFDNTRNTACKIKREGKQRE